MIARLGISGAVGIVVTLVLFYLMQALIQGADSALTEDKIGNLVDFVRVKHDQEAQTRPRKPPKPPPPEEEPPEPPKEFEVVVDDTTFTMVDIGVGININIGGGGFGMDGEYLPIVKVQPQYPRRALTRGMTGWVIVEFTVTKQGTVRDPIVVENCGWVQSSRNTGECFDSPNRVFDSAAAKAALKFKYKPKVIDGDPVDTAGVRNKITFELLED